MLKGIKLVSNYDETYDVVIEYENNNAEFGLEFINIDNVKTSSEKILEFIQNKAKSVKISSIRILVSGVLITTLAFSSFMSVFSSSNRYSMGYLYSGTDRQHIEYVNRTNNALDTVSPSYFDIEENGSLRLNYLSENLINQMHAKGIKVVPFLSNHWNRTGGINALKDVGLLSGQVANYIEKYNLDGVNVDIENVTHEQRGQYTELVRLLREKIPSNKEVSVAVAANPNDWQTGWHGSYDYTNLAKYADHLVIMAYDEHYEGSEAGPVSSISFVEKSIKYALRKTSPDKIVIAIPLYGRVWSLDNNKIIGKGISISTINDILKNCKSTVTYDEKSQSVKAEFEIKENSPSYTAGGDFVLSLGKYVVWYENNKSYSSKLNLISKYNIKGSGSWALGQEDPSIWNNYKKWLNGFSDVETPSVPNTSSPGKVPETSGKTTETSGKVPEISKEVSKGPLETHEKDSEELTPSENNESDLSLLSESVNQEALINEDETSVQIYEDQNLKGKIISSLSGGTSIDIIKHFGNGIYQIKLVDGQIGYVSSKYVRIKNTNIEDDNSDIYNPLVPYQEYVIHRVQSGDTLWKLAEKYLGSGALYTEIKTINNLNIDTIYPGMNIKILAFQVKNENKSSNLYTEYNVKEDTF